MTKQEYRRHLTLKQKSIVFESEEDEGAAEYWADLQSIIDVIDSGAMIHKIQEAADWVGETCPICEVEEFKSNLKQCSEIMAAL